MGVLSKKARLFFENESAEKEIVVSSDDETSAVAPSKQIWLEHSITNSQPRVAEDTSEAMLSALDLLATAALGGYVHSPLVESHAVLISCDRCGGAHSSDNCPSYPNPRPNVPDAWENVGNTFRSAPVEKVTIGSNAKILKQPGGGMCLFHSLSYEMNRLGATTDMHGHRLRTILCKEVERDRQRVLGYRTMERSILEEGFVSVERYLDFVRKEGYGGALEIELTGHLFSYRIRVFQRLAANARHVLEWIGGPEEATKIANLVRTPGKSHIDTHYDVIVPPSS